MFGRKAKTRQISPKFLENQDPTQVNAQLFEYKAAFDLDVDELEVLKRYESVYHAFLEFDVLKPLIKPFTESDIGRIQGTILDFSCAYALQGDAYVTEIQENMQYTVLQSALILTISMPLYISPPELHSVMTTHIFSALIGLAAFSHIIVIIAMTIISALLNRPYAASDTVVMRVKANKDITLAVILNYIADIASIAAMFVAGFSRSKFDGLIQLYSLFLMVLIIILFINSALQGDRFQDKRTLKFYLKYCDLSGRLKPEYLALIYKKKKDKNKEEEENVEESVVGSSGKIIKIDED